MLIIIVLDREKIQKQIRKSFSNVGSILKIIYGVCLPGYYVTV